MMKYGLFGGVPKRDNQRPSAWISPRARRHLISWEAATTSVLALNCTEDAAYR